jgi:hypothetical protein
LLASAALPFLNIGVMYERSQTDGIMHLSKQRLNNNDIGEHNSSQQLIKKVGGIPSGPPLVLALSRLMARRTNEGEKYT